MMASDLARLLPSWVPQRPRYSIRSTRPVRRPRRTPRRRSTLHHRNRRAKSGAPRTPLSALLAGRVCALLPARRASHAQALGRTPRSRPRAQAGRASPPQGAGMSCAAGAGVATLPSNGAVSGLPSSGPVSGSSLADGPTGRPWLQEFLRLVEASGREGATDLPPLREWVDLAEAWRIVQALERCRGNRSARARRDRTAHAVHEDESSPKRGTAASAVRADGLARRGPGLQGARTPSSSGDGAGRCRVVISRRESTAPRNSTLDTSARPGRSNGKRGGAHHPPALPGRPGGQNETPRLPTTTGCQLWPPFEASARSLLR
jgi:hypothetical protein